MLTVLNYFSSKDITHHKIGYELVVIHLYLLIYRIYALTFILLFEVVNNTSFLYISLHLRNENIIPY